MDSDSNSIEEEGDDTDGTGGTDEDWADTLVVNEECC